MASIDLVILGVVAEGPKSAYDIQKDVVHHHLDRWTQVSTPSIYKKVLRLKEEGYLQSRTVRGERLADKAVYALTRKGQARLEELMCACADEAVPLRFDFNVLIANLDKIDHAQAASLIGRLRESLNQSAWVNASQASAYPELPLAGRAIFDQQQRLYRALLEWLDDFEAQFHGAG